jgi:hypothetical protein
VTNLMNYKGIYFNDDPNSKYTCPVTGAHFEPEDMRRRLKKVVAWRRVYEQNLASMQGIHNFVEMQDSDSESEMDSEDKRVMLQREKEEFMRKMGIDKDKAKAAKAKEKSVDKPKIKDDNTENKSLPRAVQDGNVSGGTVLTNLNASAVSATGTKVKSKALGLQELDSTEQTIL